MYIFSLASTLILPYPIPKVKAKDHKILCPLQQTSPKYKAFDVLTPKSGALQKRRISGLNFGKNGRVFLPIRCIVVFCLFQQIAPCALPERLVYCIS